MHYVHLPSGQLQQSLPTPLNHNGALIEAPTWEQYRAAGWRNAVDPLTPPDGMEVVAEGAWTQDAENPDNATRTDTWGSIADRKAAEAAAQAAYLAGVDVLPRPVQGKFETSAADGHVYGLEIDPDGGEVIPVQRESTRLTQAEYDAARATRLAERATHRDRIAAIKTDLDQVETALDQIDVAATGPMGAALTGLNAVDLSAGGTLGTAIAATTGATKTALQQVRLALVAVRDNAQTAVTESRKAQADTKTAAKNLKQAAEKLRREVR